jgi:membrane fusion protein (multidrug efflux system)
MAVVQEEIESSPIRGHFSRQNLPESHRTTAWEEPSPERFHAFGFRFVRYFLLIILMTVASMVALVGFLGVHLGMDMTIEGQGQVEPTERYDVKSKRSGLIKGIYVQQGQEVHMGDLLFALNDADLKNQLAQCDGELVMNRSRCVALTAELHRERAVLDADVIRAELALGTARLQMERVTKEYEVYHKYLPYRLDGSLRPPIETLVPVRLEHARVRIAEFDIERAKRRLAALARRSQELASLNQMSEKLRANRRLIISHLEQMKVYALVSATVITRDLDKRVGDNLQAGEALMELAELDGWQVRLRVQEVDIPRVKVGQPVRIYVNAFPHMEYKVFQGNVINVPRKPESVASLGAGMVPGGIPGTQYEVKVRVIDPEVLDGESVYSLAYGMGVYAKIVIERGPIVSLIWKKFLKSVGKMGHPEIYRVEYPIENLKSMN